MVLCLESGRGGRGKAGGRDVLDIFQRYIQEMTYLNCRDRYLYVLKAL
jgi:hypothetical protein